MKNIISAIAVLLIMNAASKAQNVGIGTTTPVAKLEVKDTSNTKVYISSKNYEDSSQLIFRNRNAALQGTDFIITAPKESGLRFTTLSDLAGNTNDSLLTLRINGNMGLGVRNPGVKLDVNGGARLSGFNTLEFGGGVAGKEANAGKIGYRTFTIDALDIVGAGSSTTDRKVKIYAEGGTTLTGPLNTLGALQVNGNSGTVGQVLTSTGTGTPTWETTSFSNNIRFGFQGTAGGNVSNPYNYTTKYNTSPTDVSIGTNAIVVNKTGLYHLEGNIYEDVEYFPSATYQPFSYTYFDVSSPVFYSQIIYDNMIRDNSAGSGQKYNINKPFSIDIYLNAGTTVKFHTYTYPDTGGTISFSYTIDLRGYLISP